MSHRRDKKVQWGKSKHRKARVQRFRAKQKRLGRKGHMNHKPEEIPPGAE